MASKTHTETGAHQAEHGSSFPPLDDTTFASQIFWLVLCFGILYFVLAKIGLPRIAGIIESRQQKLDNDVETAERLQSESDVVKQSYEKELLDARKASQQLAQKSRDQAKAEADAVREKAEASLQQKLDVAEKNISDMKSKAMANVQEIAQDAAEEISSSLLNIKVTKAEVKSAVTKAVKGS